MQLEAGKKYTDRRGRVYGPMVKTGELFFGEDKDTPLWNHNGVIDIVSRDMDLVAEYVEPVQPEYRMLNDGEAIQPGDEYLGYLEKWEKVPSSGNVFKSSLYYPHRRLVELAPVESPDDWVTQDRVPGRKGIDYQNWLPVWGVDHWRDISAMDHANGKRHGYIDGMGDTLSLRCRRKDLPPVPPKTRTVVLKEWICWDDCEPEAVTVDWFSLDPSEDHGQFLAYDHAHATGNTRTVEIPVT